MAFDFKVSTLNRRIWSFNQVSKADAVGESGVDRVIENDGISTEFKVEQKSLES